MAAPGARIALSPPALPRRAVRAATVPTLLACLAFACLVLTGCAGIHRKDLGRAEAIATFARPTALDCDRPDACAEDSPLHALGDRAMAESTDAKPVNYVEIVESGQDSLIGRINLIRSARRSIDIQTFIYGTDDSGFLFFNELVNAARRGVKVRLLTDQLFGPHDLGLLANLASAHANFEMRMYNPTFGNAHATALQYVGAVACCFRKFNQRMHNKALIVDGRVAFTGGRNIEDRYFDWNPVFDFRDRDAILAGPEVAEIQRVFDLFWTNERSVPLARLKDVARLLLAHQGPPARKPLAQEHRTARVLALSEAASDQPNVAARLVEDARPVGQATFIGDGPGKHAMRAEDVGDTTVDLRTLVEGAKTSVLLQTPYLVLSKGARKLFRTMHERPDAPRVTVSTNSLASTDAVAAYALSFKYKRRYLRELGMHIFELKPYPLTVPVDVEASGALDGKPDAADAVPEAEPAAAGASSSDGDLARARRRMRVQSDSSRFYGGSRVAQLHTDELRISMHAKSLVIDDAIGIIGSHNFDPRSDYYNTEGVLVFHDPVMAQRLEGAILRDTAPDNSWLIARRPRSPVSSLNGHVAELFENLPMFDLWPFRYATSYEFDPAPGCTPVPPEDPRFHQCWKPVGDFPEVEISLKAFVTRVLTAFGAGLAPIL